jgi:hypothetical protein
MEEARACQCPRRGHPASVSAKEAATKCHVRSMDKRLRGGKGGNRQTARRWFSALAEDIGNKSGRKGEVGGAPYSSSFGCGQPEALKERHLRGQMTPKWASPFCCCCSSQRSQMSRRGWWEWRDREASAGGEVGVACHRLWCRQPMDCMRLTRHPPSGWRVCHPRVAKRAASMPSRSNRCYTQAKRLILLE